MTSVAEIQFIMVPTAEALVVIVPVIVVTVVAPIVILPGIIVPVVIETVIVAAGPLLLFVSMFSH